MFVRLSKATACRRRSSAGEVSSFQRDERRSGKDNEYAYQYGKIDGIVASKRQGIRRLAMVTE
jgi:hypothetical protein